MAKYVIWNGTDSLCIPNGEVWDAAKVRSKYAFLTVPNQKLVISGEGLNGGFQNNFDGLVGVYRSAGVDFTGCESDQDYLDAIEYFEAHPPEAPISTEERTAAALEFLAMASLPDEI